MEIGVVFLKSKFARRFFLIFIFCALAPTVAGMVLSYTKVVTQLEESSYLRLKREAQSYRLGLFDRLLRMEGGLQLIGKSINTNQQDYNIFTDNFEKELSLFFYGVTKYTDFKTSTPIVGHLEKNTLSEGLAEEIFASEKPFIFTKTHTGNTTDIFMGSHFSPEGEKPFILVGLLNPAYLWGIGFDPILPPMTGLLVFDKKGKMILTSENLSITSFQDLNKQMLGTDLRVFEFEIGKEQHLAASSNLFLEARFQKSGWKIVITQTREDIMSSIKDFKQIFPFVILFFLLLIVYLSIFFIRRGLEPLRKLKEGTKRIAKKDFSTTVSIESGDEFEELGTSFNEMAIKLDKQFNALTVLNEIETAILSSLDRGEILNIAMQSMRKIAHCDATFFFRYSILAKNHVKIFSLQQRRKQDLKVEYHQINKEEKKQLFTDLRFSSMDDMADAREMITKIAGTPFKTYLCLPITIKGAIHRTLVLAWKDEYQSTDDEIDQLRQISDQLAIALANSCLLEDMEKLAMGTIAALARTVDAKSKWTAGHSERVAVMAGGIARVMRLSEEVQSNIEKAGLLHDIGKIGIPSGILDKPGKLTKNEYLTIQTHPEIGAEILSPIEAYNEITPIVVQHHEKFDGTGYPEGLVGEEICLEARILALSDVWDALISTRPYREGWAQESAIKVIIEGSGSHFEPAVVDAFLTIINDKV